MTFARFFRIGLLALPVACGGSEDATTPTAQLDVNNPRAHAEDVLVGGSYFPNVMVGGTLPARVDFLPQFPPDWESADPSLATVSADGRITGLIPGQTVIRASVTPGSLTVASAEGTIEVFPPFVEIALGSIYSCGQTAVKVLYCWGANPRSQLGIPVSPDACQAPCAATPHRAFSTPVFAQVAPGYGMSCGLTDTGETYCWGDNRLGQLGAPPGDLANPVRLPGSVRLVRIWVGATYGCGLDATGKAYCWGTGFPSFGNLGAPTSDVCGGVPCNLTPTPVEGDHAFTSLSVGQIHACGLTGSGDAYCWGANGAGTLGNGAVSDVDGGEQVPQLVVGGIRFASISAGETNTCGTSTSGMAYCWGYNNEGQLGNGIITGTFVPVVIPTPVVGNLVFASVHTGQAHACALTAAGKAYCWGRNIHGQLGDGTTITSASPVAVAGNLTFAQLEVRRGFSCGRTAGGQVYCWGQNFYGQLGVGEVVPGAFASVPGGVGGVP